MASVEESIIQSITKNGYPQKKVSLPFKAVYDACKRKEVSLASVLKNLEQQEILNEMKEDKILFYNKAFQESKDDFTFDDIPKDILQEAMDKVKDLDPAEVEKIKQQVMQMSPEERGELMKKAKEMFKKK